MSKVLESLILEHLKKALFYQKLLERYMQLVKNVTAPEDNARYPERIRGSGTLCALYDNCGEGKELALRLYKGIRARK